ncbi:CapA family protein [Euzebya sp.]|uniref:CapA family protein n=1 Tax=Euzebya sp. TaxID=1971409 RepID=UPI0035182374
MDRQRDVVATTALGTAVAVLVAALAVGASAAPHAVAVETARPALGIAGHVTEMAAPAPTPWTGPSVVRQRTTPDRYTRPPTQPYRTFTVAATGDLLIHTPVRTRAALPGGGFDFAPQLAAAAADIAAADLAVCHLEVPLDPDGPYSSYPRFNAPAELAAGIATTGWDACSTASNHSADQGFDGVVQTLAALDAAAVAHEGMYRSEDEWRGLRLLDVDGIAVGLISATYGLNGLPAPGGHEWSVLRIDPTVILDRARSLRAAGAEVVIASLHWGAEYVHTPTTSQREVAAAVLGDGAVDAIIGHHAHVVQPVEWIAGRPVVYGLGNFLSGQRPTERRDGAVVTLEFSDSRTGWRVVAVHAQPTWVDDRYHVVLADPDAAGVLAASAQRTLGYLGVPLSPPPGPPDVHEPPPPPPRPHYERG